MSTIEESRPQFFTRPRMLLSLVCSGLFFAFFVIMLRPFVPELPEGLQWVASAYTATALTGVFFLAFNMFMVVLMDPVRARK